MLIGGLQKFTVLDYPDRLAATVFTVGCNFRCPYCHNPEIVALGKGGINFIEEDEIWRFLENRKGELDGVCITGGEPTLQKDLADFVRKVKELGFLVKIDTNGSNFEAVKGLIEADIVDYFAIDIKTSFDKYHMVSAPADSAERTLDSVKLISESGIPLELRTTVVPGIVGAEDFEQIIGRIEEKSKDIFPRLYRYSVQAFRPQKCLEGDFEKKAPYKEDVLEKIAESLRKYCNRVDVIK